MNLLPILIAIGTYTANTGSEGIYLLELDPENQKYRIVNTLAAQNPSFLHYSADNSMLYYVEDIGAGTVNSVPDNLEQLNISYITSLLTQCISSCHLAVIHEHLTTTAFNYSGGNLATLSLADDARISSAEAVPPSSASSVLP